MKITINKSNFLEGLNQVARVIAANTTFEILKGIKLEVFDNHLTLKASDSLISIEFKIDQYVDNKEILTIDEIGQIVLPSREFIEIIRKLPTNLVEIETTNDNIRVCSGKSEFNIKGMPAEDYPEFPVISKEQKLTLSSNLFNDIIRETVFATAPNDYRPILEGVNLSLQNRVLIATATDSYRLTKRQLILENEDTTKEFNMIIPKKALVHFQRMLEQDEKDVDLYYENNRIVMYYGNVIYTVLLISGKYPNVEKLIPFNFECTLIANSRELYNVVDRVSIMSRDDRDDIIKLKVQDNVLEVSSQSKELGSAVEQLDVEVDMDESKFEISVSGRYIREAINAVASEKIVIKFSGELTAFLIQPSDYHRDILELILPVRTY